MNQDPQHFLLVEDDPDHAELVIRGLGRGRASNSIDHVTDGAQAMRYLRREGPYKDRPRPNVVLLDLKLPKLDGHEVLKEIKTDPDLKSIPVVILTTSDAESDRAKAYEHFANGYVVKPLDFKQFHEMIADLEHFWGFWNQPAA